jgi:hypothetical protein
LICVVLVAENVAILVTETHENCNHFVTIVYCALLPIVTKLLSQLLSLLMRMRMQMRMLMRMLMLMLMLQVCLEGGRRGTKVVQRVCAVQVCTAPRRSRWSSSS